MLVGLIGKEEKCEQICRIWQLLDIFYNGEGNQKSYMRYVKKHLFKNQYLKAYVMRSQFKDHSPNDIKNRIINMMWGDNPPNNVGEMEWMFVNKYGINVWLDALFLDYKPKQLYPEYMLTESGGKAPQGTNCVYPCWIVKDLQNNCECDYIKEKHGIVIAIDETDQVPYDYILNVDNNSIDDITNAVRDIMVEEKIIKLEEYDGNKIQ